MLGGFGSCAISDEPPSGKGMALVVSQRTGRRPGRALLLIAVVVTALGLAAPASAKPANQGELATFGNDRWGELGYQGELFGPHPTPSRIIIPGGVGPVIEAAVGQYHTLAVTSSGSSTLGAVTARVS
jgi:regulator of chromosome condensation (RCC1) repeat-containing protein